MSFPRSLEHPPIVIQRSFGSVIAGIALSGGSALAIAYFAVRIGPTFEGFLTAGAAGFFAFVGFFFGWEVFNPPRLELAPDGFTFWTPRGMSMVPWSEIDEFYWEYESVMWRYHPWATKGVDGLQGNYRLNSAELMELLKQAKARWG